MDFNRTSFEEAVQKNQAYSARQLDACQDLFEILPDLYFENNVQRGLRDVNGNGVLVGLTNISTVTSKKIINGKTVPVEGELSYRGYRVNDLINGLQNRSQFGFEEIAYLL